MVGLLLSKLQMRLSRLFNRRANELIFAEALGQALVLGAPISEALMIVAKAPLGRRFRRAVREMRRQVQSGHTLEKSLALAHRRVHAGLLEALRAGEEMGRVAEELSAYAYTLSAHPGRMTAWAVGRSTAAVKFASALARLLQERGLTLEVVNTAARVAAANRPSFELVAKQVVADMQNGAEFAEALARHPRTFDTLYSGLVGLATTRQHLQQCMERLGEG